MTDKAAPTTLESPVDEPVAQTAEETTAPEAPAAESPPEEASAPEETGSAEEPSPTESAPEESSPEEPALAASAAEDTVGQDSGAPEPAAQDGTAEASDLPEGVAEKDESESPDQMAAGPEDSIEEASSSEAASEERADEEGAAVGAETGEPEAAAEEPEEKATLEAAGADVEEAESSEIAGLRKAKETQTAVEGRVIGWNNGGFHVVVGELTAFCPRSEMEIASPKAPKNYVDKTLHFHVLKVQKKGRRVVLSRASHLKGERSKQREEVRERLSPGAVVKGKVASLTDFGAFVELGGVQGLVHVSEISRNRINNPADVLEVGQEVEVKVLKLEKGGRRISLSMRALEPDPWRGVKERFPEGNTVIGKVEKATNFGAFIELEPGITGLLPLSAMSIPRDTSPARVYPPGREVKVLVMGVDTRRRRISLALEGSTVEGTRNDYKSFIKDQKQGSGGGSGFNALAEAFKRLEGDDES